MDTSVFTKVAEPAQSDLSESAKGEVTDFVVERLFPNGMPKLGPIDNTIIMVLSMTANVEEKMVRDWAYSIYLKAVKDTSEALLGAAKLVKMHKNNP